MVDGSATAMPPVERAVTMDTIGADMLPTLAIADPAVANEPAATANAAPEVASSAEGSSKGPVRPNFGKKNGRRLIMLLWIPLQAGVMTATLASIGHHCLAAWPHMM